ncbi:unnamed protein product, partial [marine sediment metagenome]
WIVRVIVATGIKPETPFLVPMFYLASTIARANTAFLGKIATNTSKVCG